MWGNSYRRHFPVPLPSFQAGHSSVRTARRSWLAIFSSAPGNASRSNPSHELGCFMAIRRGRSDHSTRAYRFPPPVRTTWEGSPTKSNLLYFPGEIYAAFPTCLVSIYLSGPPRRSHDNVCKVEGDHPRVRFPLDCRASAASSQITHGKTFCVRINYSSQPRSAQGITVLLLSPFSGSRFQEC